MARKFDRSELFMMYLASATLDGRVTLDEGDAISDLYLQIIHQAGMDRFDASNPAHRAVDRHAIGVMRKRLIELHPELEADLDRYIGEREGRS